MCLRQNIMCKKDENRPLPFCTYLPSGRWLMKWQVMWSHVWRLCVLFKFHIMRLYKRGKVNVYVFWTLTLSMSFLQVPAPSGMEIEVQIRERSGFRNLVSYCWDLGETVLPGAMFWGFTVCIEFWVKFAVRKGNWGSWIERGLWSKTLLFRGEIVFGFPAHSRFNQDRGILFH